MANLRERILNTHDVESELLPIPEWNETVEVRGLDGDGRATLYQQALNQETKTLDFAKAFPILALACTFDPDSGERVFQDEDLPQLKRKNGKALERIVQKAMELSGLTEGAVDEAGKSSSTPAPSEGSTSTSPTA